MVIRALDRDKKKEGILAKLPASWMTAQKAPEPDSVIHMHVKKKAAVYMRYSTENQDEFSLERQMRVAQAYADSIGVEITKVYSDPAASGAYTVNRPGFIALIEDAQRGLFQMVIVEDGDRLARKLHITAVAFDTLRSVGVELHSARFGPWSLLHAAFSGLMSEEQRTRIYALMRSGLEKIVEQGLWPGLAPVGFEKVLGQPGELRINEEFAPSIRRVFDLRIAGLGYYQIADIMEREGQPTPLGRWIGQTVRHILKNPLYCGLLLYFRRHEKLVQIGDQLVKEKPWQKMRSKDKWVCSEREDLRIVSVEIWQQAQSIDVRPRNAGPSAVYLLSAKAYCADCGDRMLIGGGHKENHMIRCSRMYRIKRQRLRLPPCHAPAVRLDSIEDHVLTLVCERLDRPRSLDRMQRAYELRATKHGKLMNAERAKLAKEREALVRKLDSTHDAAMTRGLTTDALHSMRVRLCEKLEAIETRIAAVPEIMIKHAPVLSGAPPDAHDFLGELSPGRNYKGCDGTVAKTVALFQRMVDAIIVKTDGDDGRIRMWITGPVAATDDEEGDTATIELSFPPAVRCHGRIRNANLRSSRGAFNIPDRHWESIKERLPSDVWIQAFDSPVQVRRVLEAIIAVRKTNVGLVNLYDNFGPSAQVWAAARILSYSGVLDLARRLFDEEDVEIARGLDLSLAGVRTRHRDVLSQYEKNNQRRRLQVQKRLEEEASRRES